MQDWVDFCEILFELSNEDRMNLIIGLLEERSNVTGLAQKYEITTQEVSRHLSRLVKSGLVQRDSDGMYILSRFGNSFLFTLKSQQFLSKNKEYFMSHDLNHLPVEFTARIGELDNTTIITDVMAVLQNIQEMVDSAEEHIFRITDGRFNLIYPNLQKAADRGVEFKLIETLEYKVVEDVEQFPRVSPSETRGLTDIPVFLAVSEKEVGALAFPENGQFDYRGFISTDQRVIKWCTDLFNYYWNQAIRK